MFSGEITVLEAEYIQIVTKTGLTIVVARNEDTPAELLKPVVVSVRPEKIQLSLYPPSSLNNCFEGRLINVMYLGTHVNYVVQLINGMNINVLQPNTFGNLPDRETPIYAWWAESDCLAINQMTND